ncbi:hypothetical protein [Paenibacillus beijingensis]|uniref:Uncharacterized protein n=1 Tax=Paenibacillus beijingensis TaxID=1126833 RepID=A0A0D5NKR6_9BACL|nr:hypothetical protein [Paenibacillus beijingensis]AJY75710.1 hypothetical protein VN24_15560 [Paenibacillus beijingensis]
MYRSHLMKSSMGVVQQSYPPLDQRLEAGSSKGQPFFAMYLCILLLLTVYQDFPLANMIGEIGRSPIILFMPLFVLCEVVQLSKHKKFIVATKLQKYLLVFILYLSFISVLYVFFKFIGGSYQFGSENILVKSFKVLIYFILIFLYIRHLHLVFSKINSYKVLYGCFFAIVTLLLSIMIIELISIPNALPFMHAGSNPYWRVRLLTSESSTAGSIVVVYAAILAYLTQYLGKFAKTASFIYIIGFFIYYLVVTSSKGFLIVCMLTLLFTLIKFMDFRKKRNFFLLILMAALMYLFVSHFSQGVVNSFQNDMANYSSSYTRFGTILIAFITVFHHPLGVGTGAYLFYFQEYIHSAINGLSNFYYNMFGISQINTGELLQYVSSDKNLGVKSGLFQWMMFGGIFALVFFYYVAKNMVKTTKSNAILSLAVIFILLSLLFIALEIKYEVWLLFAFISYFLSTSERNQSSLTKVTK